MRTNFDVYVFIIVFGLTRPALEATIYHTQGDHASHYTIDDANI
jgi:hypothetical protein